MLDHIAVHPDFRGCGIATLLVQAGLREADRMGLDTCVLAMRAALGVYQHAGFRLVDEVLQDASPYGGEAEYGAYFLVKEVDDAVEGRARSGEE